MHFYPSKKKAGKKDEIQCYKQKNGWELGGLGSHGTWTVGELETLLDAATKIELWFARLGGGDYRGRMRAALGGTTFIKGGLVSEALLLKDGQPRHHVRGSSVYLLSTFSHETIVHELAHVIDNRLGTNRMTALLGGGPADEMSYRLGADPSQCIGFPGYRSQCPGYADLDLDFPSLYARSGPSEDFAETFRLSVLSPSEPGLIRAGFMVELGHSLTTNVGEFQGSPYTALQRYGQGYVAPLSGYGGSNHALLSYLLR